ncbi:hypothetical protein M3J09_012434 [Ascochyta lentis]
MTSSASRLSFLSIANDITSEIVSYTSRVANFDCSRT